MTHWCCFTAPSVFPSTFPPLSLFHLCWEGAPDHLSRKTHTHTQSPLLRCLCSPPSDTAASLPSCRCLLLFPITNNSVEFPSLLSWGIFITAQSPCPEGLPALNCSTAVVWTLSSKTSPLFTNSGRGLCVNLHGS